jgi:hypothetical protein
MVVVSRSWRGSGPMHGTVGQLCHGHPDPARPPARPRGARACGTPGARHAPPPRRHGSYQGLKPRRISAFRLSTRILTITTPAIIGRGYGHWVETPAQSEKMPVAPDRAALACAHPDHRGRLAISPTAGTPAR